MLNFPQQISEPTLTHRSAFVLSCKYFSTLLLLVSTSSHDMPFIWGNEIWCMILASDCMQWVISGRNSPQEYEPSLKCCIWFQSPRGDISRERQQPYDLYTQANSKDIALDKCRGAMMSPVIHKTTECLLVCFWEAALTSACTALQGAGTLLHKCALSDILRLHGWFWIQYGVHTTNNFQ